MYPFTIFVFVTLHFWWLEPRGFKHNLLIETDANGEESEGLRCEF